MVAIGTTLGTLASVKLKLILFSVFLFVKAEGSQPALNDFPIAVLQEHIKTSRQLPVCVVFRNHGESCELESKLAKLWKQDRLTQNYTAWKIGGYVVLESDHQPAPIQLPKWAPSLTCYLGIGHPFSYAGKPTAKSLRNWFRHLYGNHADQLEEATEATMEEAILGHHQLTIVGFASNQRHLQMEETLSQIKDNWREVKVLFVHPYSADVGTLSKRFSVTSYPCVIFVENSVATKHKAVVQKVLKAAEVSKSSIELYLTLRQLPVLHLNKEMFEGDVVQPTKYYVPVLVLFYTWTAPVVVQHLTALRTTADDFSRLNVSMRYAVLEITRSSKHILEQWVPQQYTSRFPFTLLFVDKWVKTTVVSIEPMLLPDRPTPGHVTEFMRVQGVPLRNTQGEVVEYKPWGSADPTQVTYLFEGPHGTMCSPCSHNATDNLPRSSFEKLAKKLRLVKKDKIPFHLQFGSECTETKLGRVGTLPLVTSDTWQEVIEKSHVPHHPFHPNVGDEVTNVALVIFILADCGSCNRNMELFEQLQRAVGYIDGGHAYLVNCSSDPAPCKEQGVTGFPTLLAFRSLGWQGAEHCVGQDGVPAAERYVRMDYHGVLLLKSIMAWFSGVAGRAVTNTRLQPQDHDHMLEDVRLVATVLPKDSSFLPRVPKSQRNSFYPYDCYRLACERLYGQAPCYVHYSQEVPAAEYHEDEGDMVITEVMLVRRDGVKATVMQLGRSLLSTLEEDHSTRVHQLHRPHRYRVRPQLKCEDDHGLCTELIVDFTRDHGRLPVTHMTDNAFHTSTLFQDDMPVLIALVHSANITHNSDFYKVLHSVAVQLYADIVVVTVDVDQYPAWVGQFVPQNYGQQRFSTSVVNSDVPSLYIYPRLCMVQWEDHRHAAFFPGLHSKVTASAPFHFTLEGITQFARDFMKNPKGMLVKTEHF